jgi:hypothetical protein
MRFRLGLIEIIMICLLTVTITVTGMAISGYLPDINRIKLQERELDIYLKYKNRGTHQSTFRQQGG